MKLKKMLVVITAVMLAVCMCVVGASAESMFDSAKEIESGKKYTSEITKDKKDVSFKIKVDGKGKLKFNIYTTIDQLRFYVYDSNGNEKSINSDGLTQGRLGSWENRIYRSSTTECSKGILTCDVKPGTYYIQFTRKYSSDGYGDYSFSVSVPNGKSTASDSSTTKNTIKIYMEKGDKIDLGAMGSGKDLGNAKWSSSNEKAVKVSSKGKITAVKEGSATVTWKNGSESFTLYIEVE